MIRIGICDDDAGMRREFKLEIRNFRNMLMIRISNSAKEPKGEFLESTKEGKEQHGYGTRNMKRVVEKYGGILSGSIQTGCSLLKWRSLH